MSKKYVVEMNHRFIIETDNLEAVMRDYAFPDFADTPVIGETEFLDGANNWYEYEGDDE